MLNSYSQTINHLTCYRYIYTLLADLSPFLRRSYCHGCCFFDSGTVSSPQIAADAADRRIYAAVMIDGHLQADVALEAKLTQGRVAQIVKKVADWVAETT